jgi:hypothetical protein
MGILLRRLLGMLLLAGALAAGPRVAQARRQEAEISGAFGAFEEAGNIFDPATAQRLHDDIYARRRPLPRTTCSCNSPQRNDRLRKYGRIAGGGGASRFPQACRPRGFARGLMLCALTLAVVLMFDAVVHVLLAQTPFGGARPGETKRRHCDRR